MRIWVDLANSPHVPVFAPIVHELRARDHEVLLTARDFAQTLPLAALAGLDVTPIGEHGGKSSLRKARAILARARRLRATARSWGADLAVSHNSYAHGVAARTLGITYVTLMDYEHTPANHVSFRLATRVFLPAAVPKEAAGKYGARPEKVIHFDGFKEQIYLDELASRLSDGRAALPFDVPADAVVVVARPPADFAIYHRFENPLFETWLTTAGTDPGVRIILLPRTEEQRLRALNMDLPFVIIPNVAIPGRDLMAAADLVVSAGGSMNREAAILGIPAYSLYAGEIGAVDRRLEDMGRMRLIREAQGLRSIPLQHRTEPQPMWNDGLAGELVDRILRVARPKSKVDIRNAG